ncbi:hypothetical protein B1H10_07740 [candidate division KSB1 bacterium 4484_188]|nr:MAG: hypothetical protein B1H10_07740 [candidate division KSB1 bacterium 4484_188]
MKKQNHGKNRTKDEQSVLFEAILNYLKKRKSKSYTSKELARAINIHKTNYHLYRQALQEALKAGKIIRLKGRRYTLPSSLSKVQGGLQLTRRGFGFVTDDRTGEEIFIPAQHLNTALDGDEVQVQIFATSRGKKKEGQIVKILSRAHSSFVGTYHRSEYYGFVKPDNPRVYRDFYIQPQNAMKAKNGQKVVVEFLKWDSSSLNPEGKIVEILGFPDEPGVDVVSVLKGFELPLQFPAKVEQEANRIELRITRKTGWICAGNKFLPSTRQTPKILTMPSP